MQKKHRSCAKETLCCLGQRKKHCSLYTRNTCCLSRRKKHCHCAEETLCCLGRRKKHCSLCKRNTLLSWPKKETLFPVHKKQCFFLLPRQQVFLVYRKKCFFLLPRQQSVSFVQGTVFLSLAKTTKWFLLHRESVSFFCQDNKERNTVPCAQETQCFFLLARQQVFAVYRKQCFLSSAKTTKCFFCTGNSVSFFCQDNKVFLVHREQCFFLLPRKQSVSFIQETVFLSLAKTTKCFFCIGKVFLSFAKTTKRFLHTGNNVSFSCQDNKVFLVHREQCFFCQDNKVFLVHREQCFFLWPRQQSVSCLTDIIIQFINVYIVNIM